MNLKYKQKLIDFNEFIRNILTFFFLYLSSIIKQNCEIVKKRKKMEHQNLKDLNILTRKPD